MKNRIFENKKISRTPLDLGSRLVDLISRYFIISRFILLLKRLKSFILALKRLKSFILAFRSFRSFNKKIAFLSRISPNIAHFLTEIIDRFPNSCNFEACAQPQTSLAKVRNHTLNLRALTLRYPTDSYVLAPAYAIWRISAFEKRLRVTERS